MYKAQWMREYFPRDVFSAPLQDGCVTFTSDKGDQRIAVQGMDGSATVALFEDGFIDESVFDDDGIQLSGRYMIEKRRILGRATVHVKDNVVAVVIWRFGSDGKRLSFSTRNCFN